MPGFVVYYLNTLSEYCLGLVELHYTRMYSLGDFHGPPSIASQKPGRKKVLELRGSRITEQARSSTRKGLAIVTCSKNRIQ